MSSIGVGGPRAVFADTPDIDDPGDVGSAQAVLDMARAFGAEPGAFGIGVLANVQLRRLDEAGLCEVLAMLEAQAGWLAAVTNEAVCVLQDKVEAAGGDAEARWGGEQLALAQQLSGYEAHRRTETALALRDRLPATGAALAAGEISARHADAIARATAPLPESAAARVEVQVLADPRAVSTRQYLDLARRLTAGVLPAVTAVEAAGAQAARSVRSWDNGDGTGSLRALLAMEDLTRVTAGIDALAAPLGPGDDRTVAQRRADALVDLVAATPAGAGGAQGTVVLQVPISLLAAGRPCGVATLHGQPVPRDTVRRIGCDSVLQRVLTDPATGAVLDVGRAMRIPGARLRRAVEVRDGHACTFPGCTRRANLHAHHVRHWSAGGATSLANLTLVCARHHHAIHEAGWAVRRAANGALRWTSPNGETHTAPPHSWRAPPDPPWPETLVPPAVSRDLPAEPPF